MLNFKIVESQKLIFSKGPVVAADTTNLEAKFEVNDLFDGTLRAYWNVRGSAVDSFKVDLNTSRTCTIPSEVLASISDPSMYGDIDHILQVSVVSIGDDDTIRITSTTCEIPVYKSSYTGNISQPSKPSGDGTVTNIITGAALNGKQLDFYNGNNVIFSAPLDRLDSFLLPLLGGTMQGDINMKGHAITGLPNAVNDTDALALAFAKTLFAPSGYGYGEPAKFIDVDGEEALESALDAITATMQNGEIKQIKFTDGSNGVTKGTTFYGRLVRHTHTYTCLFAESYSYNGAKIQKIKYNGTWYPFEWENPPMAIGVEYRTTERYNRYVVYTQLFFLGQLSGTANTAISVDLSEFGISAIVDWGGEIVDTVDDAIYAIPYKSSSVEYITVVTADSLGVKCSVGSNKNKVYMWIKYCKG